jgi:trk system potassium uptake protein TrkA
MPTKKEFCVIGLGAFGSALARDLYERGNTVLGIDLNEKLVNEHQDHLSQVLVADATNENAMRAAGVADCDYCIVAIGDHIEDNILATQTVIDLGVKRVWSRAESTRHAKILEKLGVERVVDPELEMAHRCSKILGSRSVLDIIEFSPGFSLLELVVGPTHTGESLKELNFRQAFNATVVAIRRKDKTIPVASPDDIILEGDVLFVAGRTEDIEKIERI